MDYEALTKKRLVEFNKFKKKAKDKRMKTTEPNLTCIQKFEALLSSLPRRKQPAKMVYVKCTKESVSHALYSVFD